MSGHCKGLWSLLLSCCGLLALPDLGAEEGDAETPFPGRKPEPQATFLAPGDAPMPGPAAAQTAEQPEVTESDLSAWSPDIPGQHSAPAPRRAPLGNAPAPQSAEATDSPRASREHVSAPAVADHLEAAHADQARKAAEADLARDNQASGPVQGTPPMGLAPEELEALLEAERRGDDKIAYEPVSQDPQLWELERRAYMKWQLQDLSGAEAAYIDLLKSTEKPEEKSRAYLRLADYYAATGKEIQYVSVMEKFMDRFPVHPEIPNILLQLGNAYRNFGTYQRAIDSYFKIMKLSLRIPPSELEAYEAISLQAKFEIAETYYEIGNYQLAAQFFERVRRSVRSQELQALARLKMSYAHLLLQNFGSVIDALKFFANDYPDSRLNGEARFLLARAYSAVGQTLEARQVALNIFASDMEPLDDAVREYWLKTLGNQLANDFFLGEHYASAHRIYHALLPLSDNSTWRWPIILQIGLCLEGQEETDRAQALYEELLSEMTPADDEEHASVTATSRELRRKIEQRVEQLRWNSEFGERLKSILPSPS